MRHQIEVHNKGHSSQYFILKVYRNGSLTPIVHTSKSISYLYKILKRY